MLGQDSTSAAWSSSLTRAGIALFLAWTAWVVAFLITVGLVLSHYLNPIPYGVYAAAGRHWLRHQPLYDLHNIDGFQYFPQSAIVFSFFAKLGSTGGNVAWRAVNWAAYAFGIWRASRRLAPTRPELAFLIATGLAVVPSTGALGNAQANLSLAALMLHTAVELSLERWNRATVLLAFGLALKPLMAPMLFLCWVIYPALRWRVLLGLILVVLAPFALRDPDYVLTQYSDCWIKLKLCAMPDRLFEDLRSLLSVAGLNVSHTTYMFVRLGGAAAALAVGLWAHRRVEEPLASVLIAAYAASYLMLFNPRTLSSSYVMTIGPAALLETQLLFARRTRMAATVFAILICWTINYHDVPFVEHWLRPSGCSVFWIVLVYETWFRGSWQASSPSRARTWLSERVHCFVQNSTLQDCAIVGLTAFLAWKAVVDTPHAIGYVRAETVGLLFVSAGSAFAVRGELVSEGPGRALLYRIGMFGSITGSYFTLRVLLAALHPKLLDPQLLAIDTYLFGMTPASWLDPFVTPARVEWFAFFYFGYYWLLIAYFVGTLLFDRGQRRYELLLGATLVAVIGQTTYTFVPGVGPWAYAGLTFQHQLTGGNWWHRVLSAVTSAGAQLDIFPSLHTGFSTLIALHACRYRRELPMRVVWLGTVFVVLNIIGATLFLRWHYGIDVIVGLVLAWAAQRTAIFTWRFEGRRQGGPADQLVWEPILPNELSGAERNLIVCLFALYYAVIILLVLSCVESGAG